MATQAQLFVPTAVEKVRSIKNQMIALQSAAASLKGEFTASMNDLTTAHNAVALSTLYSLQAYDDVTKIAIG